MPYYVAMSRLLQIMNDQITIKGAASAKAIFKKATGRSSRQVERWLAGENVPSAHSQYLLAMACGLSKQDALALAREGIEAKKAS